MSRSSKRLIGRATISLVLIVLGVLAVWFAQSRREPTYAGRALSDWLNHHVPTSAAEPPYNSPGWHKAEEALRAIGTNGIPVLLKMIQAEDPPPFMRALAGLANRVGLRIPSRPALPRIEEAEYAFSVLSTNAVSAVPELMRIYQRNISPASQNSCALALGHIGKGAQEALPLLIRNFTHTNQQVRFYAVSAVLSIRGDPEIVVPALTTVLKDSSVDVRWNALVGLSQFFGRARSSVPEILKMMNDPGMVGTDSITQQVATAVWRIAPEKIGSPLIVEQATPLVAGGVTTQAFKIEHLGKRNPLIPQGRAIPALAQHWNSDPRPSLKLFRGEKGRDENDHFLGEFEVLDVAAEPSVNISTLVIIADGQIILNARDNTREKFLPVRRKQ